MLHKAKRQTVLFTGGVGTWMNNVVAFRLAGYDRGQLTVEEGERYDQRTGTVVLVGGVMLAAYLVYFR